MFKVKTPEEIEIMREGGQKLALVKKELAKMVVPGALPLDIDKKAQEMILSLGGEPSFKKVRGYGWTTCININDGVVHGIPGKKPFNDGDIVKIDVGIFYKGFHNDSAFSLPAGNTSTKNQDFLDAGKEALKKSIAQAIPENRISDISIKMAEIIMRRGYTPVRDLTGHGVGRQLHEQPLIPCFWEGDRGKSPLIPVGATLAIEVIYTQGDPELEITEDGWTIVTQDGKIASLFEETVAVAAEGPQILSA
ncbi:MAG: type I methionyl aminopeptidase [Candidatus Blackburnbacteria bacterium RIFCSPHIGHO2_01_FULL_43_15b]|uniref:Methionine aminopeptidase n=1 Tax=Candidatus Blackburnbacteria bacterium RIFCSPHIGHO2_01_FULL_43_15b TaxID=1797513 RepID=A0A1G1UZ07_9BACT|nr:MAG: type I methionyl aminopeptidase [Candidatus Blackburnbacteria bacterium RIFCSPHIGHO2_01_FULL_43_15b]